MLLFLYFCVYSSVLLPGMIKGEPVIISGDDLSLRQPFQIFTTREVVYERSAVCRLCDARLSVA